MKYLDHLMYKKDSEYLSFDKKNSVIFVKDVYVGQRVDCDQFTINGDFPKCGELIPEWFRDCLVINTS